MGAHNLMNILITSAGGDSAIATIRILKATTKHKVFAIDCNQYAAGFYLADQYAVVPRADSKLYISEIAELVQKHKIDLIIPTVEEELLKLVLNLGEIPCHIILSPLATIITCENKLSTIKLLRDIIPTPEVYTKLSEIEFPAIIKPASSRGSRDIFLVKDQDEAEAIYSYLTSFSPEHYSYSQILFQEYLPGDEYTVDLVCDKKGKPLVIVPRLRLATKGGISTIGKTVKDNQIIKLVKKIVAKIPFYGPVNIQFKKDKFGEIKLLEINPRTSGGLPITYQAGVNIPLLTVKTAFSQEIKPEELLWQETLVYRYLQEGKV